MALTTIFGNVTFFFGSNSGEGLEFYIHEDILEEAESSYLKKDKSKNPFTSYRIEQISDPTTLRFKDKGLVIFRPWYEDYISGRINELLSEDEAPIMYVSHRGAYYGSLTCEAYDETHPTMGIPIEKCLEVLENEMEDMKVNRAYEYLTSQKYYRLETLIERVKDEIRANKHVEMFVLPFFHPFDSY